MQRAPRNPARVPWLAAAIVAAAFGAALPAQATDTSIHGRVTGQTSAGEHLGPVAGAEVVFQTASGQAAGSAKTDAAGYYRVPSLQPGAYVYRLKAAGFRPEEAGRGFELSAEGAHVLDFVLTQGSDDEPAPADKPGALLVRVWKQTDGGKEPFSRALIAARRADGGPLVRSQAGPEGRSKLNVPAGAWTVSAFAPGYSSAVMGAPVELEADGQRRVDLTLVRPGDPAPPAATPVAPAAGEGANFYGSAAKGQRFVFVVDNSLSMRNGKFETATGELLDAIRDLTEKQQFYVIFFSDTLHPMFEPDAPEDYLPASDANVARLEAHIAKTRLQRGTKAQTAMERAFELKPDAIYLLTDGAFTDKTLPFLLNREQRGVPIHTVGYQAERGANNLKRISAAYGGTYTYVP